MIQRIWCITAFLVLTGEDATFWGRHWSTPSRSVSDFLFYPVPGLRVPFVDLVVLGLLAASWGRSTKGRAAPMEKAIWFSIGTILAWGLLGLLRGGSAFEERLQLHYPVMVLVAGLMQIRVFVTPAHFRMLGKTIVYAGLFRFGQIFIFYVTIMRSLNEHLESVTSHADSMLFAACIVIVLANAVHVRTKKAIWKAVVISALMLWSMQVNNRRLAYVGLAGSLFAMYAMINIGPARKIINRYLLRGLPVLALYVAVGWSHPTGIFRPIASLQSVNDPSNPSTQSRILENIGLVVTLQTNPLIGTGFGHEYIEISTAFSVGATIFPEYRYDPHNSALGWLAFTGALGFTGLWMVFPVVVYLNARSYAFAGDPLVRNIAMVGVCVVFIHINQLWGDLGALAGECMCLVSGAMAAASRMAPLTGAWEAASRRARPPAGGTRGRTGFSRAAPSA